MSCALAHQDAAYVLGALSPAERSDYQHHLADCEECARSVRMLAGMPGLLARVSADVLELSPQGEPVPGTLLPALVDEVRHRERRRAWLVSGLAAAAAVVVIAGSVALGEVLLDDGSATPAAPAASVPSATSSTAPARPMYAVRPLPLSAELSLTSVDWGTRLDLTCTYDRPEGGRKGKSWRYALVVQTPDGDEQVATWVARPGSTLRITGATASPANRIESVEVRTPDGETLLRLHA